jgi:SAM-dependent methyltransferase
LVLAHHPALFSVGLTALLGISYSLLATLFLVPISIRWLAKQNSRRRQIFSPTPAQTLRAVSRLYRFQGPYVSQFVYWKMKADPLFRAVEKVVPARGEILDVGCGYGLVAHWLTLFTPERRVRGVDFDADKIRVAQVTAQANPQVKFELRDILEWPEYPPCDCALLCDVLHYFPHDLKADVLRKIFAALRPGGCLILRDAMAKEDSGHRAVAISEQWAVHLGQNQTRYGLHFEDKKNHLALVCEAGFAKVEVRNGSGLGSNLLLIARKVGDAIT